MHDSHLCLSRFFQVILSGFHFLMGLYFHAWNGESGFFWFHFVSMLICDSFFQVWRTDFAHCPLSLTSWSFWIVSMMINWALKALKQPFSFRNKQRHSARHYKQNTSSFPSLLWARSLAESPTWHCTGNFKPSSEGICPRKAGRDLSHRIQNHVRFIVVSHQRIACTRQRKHSSVRPSVLNGREIGSSPNKRITVENCYFSKSSSRRESYVPHVVAGNMRSNETGNK